MYGEFKKVEGILNLENEINDILESKDQNNKKFMDVVVKIGKFAFRKIESKI